MEEQSVLSAASGAASDLAGGDGWVARAQRNRRPAGGEQADQALKKRAGAAGDRRAGPCGAPRRRRPGWAQGRARARATRRGGREGRAALVILYSISFASLQACARRRLADKAGEGLRKGQDKAVSRSQRAGLQVSGCSCILGIVAFF